MAGYTDRVYRQILREHGAPYCYTEMISGKGLVLGGLGSTELLFHGDEDRPLAVQIFGSDPGVMGEAAAIVASHPAGFEAIDINMGCPSRKIVSDGAGGALTGDIPRASSIVRAVRDATSLPVTVKIRVEKGNSDRTGFARALADSGADLIAVHGRTVSQGYSGKADWDAITAISKAVSVPVVGNGDVASAQDALDILNSGAVAGVMIGRGMLGNPGIFRDVRQLFEGQPIQTMSPEDKMELAKDHFLRSIHARGPRQGLLCMRAQLPFYFRGFRGASRLRGAIVHETSPEGVLKILDEAATKE